MSQKTFSKKAKELLKKVKDIAATGALTTGGAGSRKAFTVTETKRGKPHWTQEGQDASIKSKFQRKSDAYHKKLKSKK